MRAWHFGEDIMLYISPRQRKFFEYRKSPVGRHWNVGRLRLIVFTSR